MAVLPEPLTVFTLTGANMSQQQDVRAERVRWKKTVSPVIRWGKPLIRAGNVLTKWSHGFYQTRRIDSAWYTPDSLPVRRSFAGLTLSWKWPSIPSDSTS
jgi:hypothetical protein